MLATLTCPAARARPDRRAAILLTAEQPFAQSDCHAVSLRPIAAEAGVPLAVVGYYSDAKHELFEFVCAHWQPTIDRRLELLQEVMTGPQPPTLRRVMQVFVEPVLALRASHAGHYHAVLVARETANSASHEGSGMLAEMFDPLAHRFIDALYRLRPHWPRVRAAWAYQFAAGALVHHMVDVRVQRLSRGRNLPGDPAVAPLFIDFITAGVEAVLPVKPRNH